MKIFCINLDKDKEKWENIQKQAKLFNLNIERYPGIYFKDLDDEMKDKIKLYFTKKYSKFASDGAFGCFFSHFTLWNKTVKNSLNDVIILEDDVRFDKNLVGDLNDILNNLPKDYDIAFLNCRGICGRGCKNKCTPYNKYFEIPVWSTTTSAYIISNKGANKLINNMLPLEMDFDAKIGYLIKDKILNGYSLKKPIFKQENKELSNITEMRKPIFSKLSFMNFINQPIYKLPFPFPLNFYIDIYSLIILILSIIISYNKNIKYKTLLPIFLMLIFTNSMDFIFGYMSLEQRKHIYHALFDTIVPIIIFLFVRNTLLCKC